MAEFTNVNQFSDPNVYGYSFSNQAKECNTHLTFTMWRKTLKIAIEDPLSTDENGNVQYDFKNAATIFLSHSKARILSIVLKELMANPVNFNRAIQVSNKIIIVSSGELINLPGNPCFLIQTISESGKVESSKTYVFKNNYHCTYDNFDSKTGKYDVNIEQFKYLEIEQIITLLEEYYKAMTGCIAFAVIDNMKFNMNKIIGNQNKFAAKLGVDLGSSKGANTSRSSYFNNGGQSKMQSFGTASLDDLG